MSRVVDLIPGQRVENAIFVAATHHPIWPSLMLVIWKMPDGSWSHDALDPRQEVGEAEPSDHNDRLRNLRSALLNEAPK